MARVSIADVVVQVLGASTHPMTAREIYDAIISQELYEFKAKDPFAILRAQLNKHCVQNHSKWASPQKLFDKADDKYSLR